MAEIDPRDAMTGIGWQCKIGNKSAKYPGWLPQLAKLCPTRLWWWRNEPETRNGVRLSSGLPDYGCTLDGRPILIECKHTSNKAAVSVGRLVKNPNREAPEEGVSWIQAENMDAATLAGWTCFIAVRLEVNESTRQKAAQATLDGKGGDLPTVILRLIPWQDWRRWMQRAEDARREMEVWRARVKNGEKVSDKAPEIHASIPALTLAEMGFPCRNAWELGAALGIL